MTISDLCNQVLVYIQAINIGNKSGAYTPSGSLVSGATLKTRSMGVKHCPSFHGGTNYSRTTTVTHSVKTNESIGSSYQAQATNALIQRDWLAFKNAYIDKMLNLHETVSVSSMFVFIYLVRCFIDTRFKLFTDVYNISYVWLYNTSSSVSYNVGDIYPTNFTDWDGIDNLNDIVSFFSDEVSSRRHIHILKATVTSTTS